MRPESFARTKRAGELRPGYQPKKAFLKESLIYSVIHADGIFLRPAASQKPRNSAAIPSVSFLAGCKNLLVIAKTSLNQRFPKITEVQSRLQNIQQQKISGDNIYQFLLYFDKLYHRFNDAEKKELIVSFVESVGIYEQEQLNGRILKSIKFRFPVYFNGIETQESSWDSESTVERLIAK